VRPRTNAENAQQKKKTNYYQKVDFKVFGQHHDSSEKAFNIRLFYLFGPFTYAWYAWFRSERFLDLYDIDRHQNGDDPVFAPTLDVRRISKYVFHECNSSILYNSSEMLPTYDHCTIDTGKPNLDLIKERLDYLPDWVVSVVKFGMKFKLEANHTLVYVLPSNMDREEILEHFGDHGRHLEETNSEFHTWETETFAEFVRAKFERYFLSEPFVPYLFLMTFIWMCLQRPHGRGVFTFDIVKGKPTFNYNRFARVEMPFMKHYLKKKDFHMEPEKLKRIGAIHKSVADGGDKIRLLKRGPIDPSMKSVLGSDIMYRKLSRSKLVDTVTVKTEKPKIK